MKATEESDQKREDDVLRRMLATKPKPHKPVGEERLKKIAKQKVDKD